MVKPPCYLPNTQEASGMDPFKNLQVNLLANVGWAIVGILAICITALSVFGDGEMAGRAMTGLTLLSSMVVAALIMRPRD